MGIYKKIGSKRSLAKFELFTSNEQLWSSAWAKQRLIRSNFPHFIGGSLAEEDLSNDMNGTDLQQEPLLQVTIGARSKETIRIDKPATPGQVNPTTVQYCFHVLARSVTYTACFVPVTGDATIVFKFLEEQGQVKNEQPTKGEWSIDDARAGSIQIEFDNTHSSLRSKTVVYSVDVE